MTLVSDGSGILLDHVTELERIGQIDAETAEEYRSQIREIDQQLRDAYE